MNISDEQLAQLAVLARLDCASDTSLRNDVDRILHFVEQLQSVDTSQTAPLLNPLEMTQRLRPDVVTEPDDRERYQKCAPLTEGGLFLVPRVVE
ncbi:Asp-tRNA(Asn)/Glu-tRNA(Gln) amidotransferase subunit GatC [Allohahella sp. A8]|uniref:Asp-tRNA(Asn)/Glu-tRNA(Gln) amidotransferase subunit GatC n=1 Tax=Allohahella sp. A8 TaxID=3141461 RepID=UPI003A805740